MSNRLIGLLVACYALLSGCASTTPIESYQALTQNQVMDADHYTVEIKTWDNKLLKATVFQPELRAGETAPLVIHSHGFGGFRADGPMSFYGNFVISGEAAVAAWEAGYWVISYDHRGFGSSEGEIHLMDPKFEVEDFSSVIDWAEENLPGLARDAQGDVLVGGVGESYGGGVQILASMKDPRIDAIVPITTWFNLEQVMAPNGHVKGAWGGILVGAGVFSSFFDFGMITEDKYLNLVGGKMNPKVQSDLAVRSPSHYCEQGQAIQSDALFIQGFRDTLMPVNQGYYNWQCALRAGRDARLIGIQDGHVLPWPMQSWSGMPVYNTQPEVVCGEKTFSTVGMIVQWFDEKLKHVNTSNAQSIPSLCMTYSDETGDDLPQMVFGGATYDVRPTNVKLMHSGIAEFLFTPGESVAAMFAPVGAPEFAEEAEVTGGTLRPAFIPLAMIPKAQNMAGIPLAELEFTPDSETGTGTAYVAIGVREPGSPEIKVLGDQFTPLVGAGHYRLELPGVSYQFQPGDMVGLVVQGFTAQYFLDPEGWLDSAKISGEVQLPLLEHGRKHQLAAQ